jgi:peptide/nickel transport system substrate-binding protein
MLTRRTLMKLLAPLPALGLSAAVIATPIAAANAESILRVSMTAADIPLTSGQPSQGAEGIRFMGITMYDGLTRWDLSKFDEAAKIVPGLAESWSVSDTDKKVWTFKLRPGVKFHDGSTFNADAVIFNFEKLMKRDSPFFDQAQSNQGGLWYGGIASWKKVDDMTVEITTKRVDAMLPFALANIFMSSPARFEEVGRDWTKFAETPSGTGPWKMDNWKPRERAELVKFEEHWDKTRIPKTDRLVLLPMPDANTRVAALLSGQTDWIEAPPPDAIPRLKQSGMNIVTNVYPHIWPWQLSVLDDSPFKDVRIRKAANLAIDREGMVRLLGNLAVPAAGMVTKGHPWFGTPSFELKYDPEAAKALLAEAGYSPDNPVKAKIIISPSGSGQMQPLPMNELIKENLREVGIDIEFEVLEWEALRTRRRQGAWADENKGRHGINNSWAFWDPDIGLVGVYASFLRVPGGFNWGGYNNPKADELATKAKATFDPDEQAKVLAELHTLMVNEALWLWAVHDLNPRAMSPKVKGFVQAQSWFQDLTPVTMED